MTKNEHETKVSINYLVIEFSYSLSLTYIFIWLDGTFTDFVNSLPTAKRRFDASKMFKIWWNEIQNKIFSTSYQSIAGRSPFSRLVIERCQLYVIAEYERKLTENVKNKVCYIKKYVRFPFYVFHNFTFFSYKLDIEGFLRSFTSLYCWFLYYELLLINDIWFLVRLRYIRNIIIFYFPFWSSKLRWKKYWI